MVKKTEKYSTLSADTTSSFKEKMDDSDFEVLVYENDINICDDAELGDHVTHETNQSQISTITNDIKTELLSVETPDDSININVTVQDEVCTNDEIKIRFDNGLFFCMHCDAYYEEYCNKCGVLVHILNRNVSSNMENEIQDEIPQNILEIRNLLAQKGIFALKVIPKGVTFGPFNGLGSAEGCWRLKGGKFIISKEKLKLLNWMKFIRSAKSICEQNLQALQYNNNLYYQSTREIQVDDELLVYYGEEYEDSLSKNIEVDFIPVTKEAVKYVFACTFCSLGFSSRCHLEQHKGICPSKLTEEFSLPELVQCTFCKIYLEEKEYSGHHMAYCRRRHARWHVPLTLDSRKTEVNGRKKHRRQKYTCKRCNYGTIYKVELKTHALKHHKVKVYRCGICRRRFKAKKSLVEHVESVHVHGEAKDVREHCAGNALTEYVLKKSVSKVDCRSQDETKRLMCSECDFRTNRNSYLRAHAKTKHSQERRCKCDKCPFQTDSPSSLSDHLKIKHLKEFRYDCKVCGFKALKKTDFARHIKTKHLREFDYDCAQCPFKTNHKWRMRLHVTSVHMNEYRFKCNLCDYRNNSSSHVKRHVMARHLKTFSFECDRCAYKTNSKQHLEAHVKTTHLKEFDYECDICRYRTNQKSVLEKHIKTKHLKEFNYKCDECPYQTNRRWSMKVHSKTMHLREFSHACDACDYRTNCPAELKRHTDSKHLKRFRYRCRSCPYRSNQKGHLQRHFDAVHGDSFKYVCQSCEYKTNHKAYLEMHTKTKHLEEFEYKCENCQYKTNNKYNFEGHLQARHLREFRYKCDLCEYKSNLKTNLTNHTKSIHLREFSHRCETCEYKTNNKSNLAMHVQRVHLNERNFECATCGHKTNSKYNLARHIKARHATGYEFECEFAECKFKTNIRSHLNFHTKSKHSSSAVRYQR